MAANRLEIIILVENSVYKNALLAEHGLSFWFKYGDKEYLYDTGRRGLVLKHNAGKLGLNLSNLSGVFLSHGHFDHTGGLKELLKLYPVIPVYAHSAVFRPKLARIEENELEKNGIKVKRNEIKNYIELKDSGNRIEGIGSVVEINCTNDFEEINKKFIVREGEGYLQDDFPEEQTLFIETGRGLVVISGCAHTGIVNSIKKIREVAGNKKIHTLIGGMHLGDASKTRIKKTVEYLQTLELENLIPLHCTGYPAIREMEKAFGKRLKHAHVGDRITV